MMAKDSKNKQIATEENNKPTMNSIELIRSKIYEIRGHKVMIDRDLAEMYGVETRRLNEQVKRNIDRFPEDFMFQLSKEEFINLMSQNATSSWGGTRKLPNAFTELGVAMLSSVLTSKIAVHINMGIMRAFVTVRQILSAPKTDIISELSGRVDKLEQYIEDVITDVNDVNEDTRMQIELLNETMAELQAEIKPRQIGNVRRIGFKTDD